MNKIIFNRSKVLILSISLFLLALLAVMVYVLIYVFKDDSVNSSENSSEAAYFIDNFGR